MSTLPFQTILFDLDGTLVDTAPDLAGALNHVLREADLAPVSVGAVRDIVGLGARVTIERGFAHHGITLEDAALDAAHKSFLDFYESHICVDSVPYEGVVEVLEALRADGAVLGVCTNKPEGLSILLLEQLGLAHHFATICGSDTVPHRKPHADHILTALARADGSPQSAVMVGDSRADIDAAKAANIPVIGMTYGYTPIPVGQLGADIVLDRFTNVPSALTTLSQQRTPA